MGLNYISYSLLICQMSHFPDCILMLVSYSRIYYTMLLIQAFDPKIKDMDKWSTHWLMFMHHASVRIDIHIEESVMLNFVYI